MVWMSWVAGASAGAVDEIELPWETEVTQVAPGVHRLGTPRHLALGPLEDGTVGVFSAEKGLALGEDVDFENPSAWRAVDVERCFVRPGVAIMPCGKTLLDWTTGRMWPGSSSTISIPGGGFVSWGSTHELVFRDTPTGPVVERLQLDRGGVIVALSREVLWVGAPAASRKLVVVRDDAGPWRPRGTSTVRPAIRADGREAAWVPAQFEPRALGVTDGANLRFIDGCGSMTHRIRSLQWSGDGTTVAIAYQVGRGSLVEICDIGEHGVGTVAATVASDVGVVLGPTRSDVLIVEPSPGLQVVRDRSGAVMAQIHGVSRLVRTPEAWRNGLRGQAIDPNTWSVDGPAPLTSAFWGLLPLDGGGALACSDWNAVVVEPDLTVSSIVRAGATSTDDHRRCELLSAGGDHILVGSRVMRRSGRLVLDLHDLVPVETGTRACVQTGQRSCVQAGALTLDGERVAFADGNQVRTVGVDGKTLWERPMEGVWQMVFLDAHHLAVTQNKVTSILSAATGETLQTFEGRPTRLQRFPDGDLLISELGPGLMVFRRVTARGQVRWRLSDFGGLMPTEDGRTLVGVRAFESPEGKDRSDIVLIDASSGKKLRTLKANLPYRVTTAWMNTSGTLFLPEYFGALWMHDSTAD